MYETEIYEYWYSDTEPIGKIRSPSETSGEYKEVITSNNFVKISLDIATRLYWRWAVWQFIPNITFSFTLNGYELSGSLTESDVDPMHSFPSSIPINEHLKLVCGWAGHQRLFLWKDYFINYLRTSEIIFNIVQEKESGDFYLRFVDSPLYGYWYGDWSIVVALAFPGQFQSYDPGIYPYHGYDPNYSPYYLKSTLCDVQLVSYDNSVLTTLSFAVVRFSRYEPEDESYNLSGSLKLCPHRYYTYGGIYDENTGERV